MEKPATSGARARPSARVWATALAALVPAGVAATHLPIVADAAHDTATVRVLGLAPAGVLRALDAVVAAAIVPIPMGTRAWRASFASTLCLALAAALMFSVAERRSRLGATAARAPGVFAALVVACFGALAPALQLEATSPGGATLGLLLALLPRALAMRGASLARVALCLGLAFAYEPLVGLLALAASGAALHARRATLPRSFAGLVPLAAAFLAGFAPLLGALALTHPARGAVFVDVLGEHWGPSHAPLAFAVEQLGVVGLGLAIGGLGVALASPALRTAGASSLVVVAICAAAIFKGSALGPDRYGAPALMAVTECALLVATAIGSAVAFVRETKVAYAQASGSLLMLMLAAMPARQADDALVRFATKQGAPERAFAALAWEHLPLGALVLVAGDELALRVASARAQGDVRGDVLFVTMRDRAVLSLLAREPRLAPLLRDQSLYGAPEEWSLSALAAARPLALSFDAAWPRPLSRHLVPAGIFDRFYAEPRGLSDRGAALDAQHDDRAALVRALTRAAAPEVARAVAAGYRARLIGAAASGDRDIAGRVLEDLRHVAPADPVAFDVARRLVGVRGAIDVSDLKGR